MQKFPLRITCSCRKENFFNWKPCIKFICAGCKNEINYAEAIFAGRAKFINSDIIGDYIKSLGKKGR